ncbi:hypothetical protein AALO_G00028740 [Alosa alosa]|uniref:C2H2-type domain-containing protein n=2 Tax=Alosa alosa TaxID=278164 RepID=A0AAV6HBK4_9TELE|nr:zinc finger protein 16 isoform X1 [Alosa alosa]KAG5284625.1 hypothetical protein AALO_G00028740 [Alosa alosa]
MSANESTSSSLVAELSFSFQDELTATIQNALGVAVEIAVVEITKLVTQVLRGVRDQMHETLSDNKSLKFRLQAAELELSAVRDRMEEQRHTSYVKKDAACNIDIQQVHDQLTSLSTGLVQTAVNIRTQDCEINGEAHSNHRVTDSADVKEIFNILDEPPDTETFCEIREDGRVCTQDIKQDVTEEPQLQSQEGPVTKEEQLGLRSCNQKETSHFSEESSARAQSAPQALPDDQSKLSGTAVKVEVTAQNCSSGSVSYGTEGDDGDFGADSLSLAQSQLLEDWRPEPLQLQGCDADTFTPSTSHSLADSPIFSADIPDLALLAQAGTGHPVPFSKPYSHRNPVAPPTSSSAQNQPYPPHSRGQQHVCKVCGQNFRLSEELRRHRKNHIRSPKKSLFPPGRSPYHCSLCGRDFNRMEHLKIHQRIHTGERPYACSVCNARFRHSWALTRHFRIHTGEKPYACGICGKTFRNCGGLRFHQRSHGVGAVG